MTSKDELRAVRKIILKAAVNGDLTIEDLERQEIKNQHLVLGIPYLETLILNLLEGEKQKLAKAYGGCTLCYGKGYATGAEFWTGRGKTWGRANKIKYCTCDRGKQLATLNKEPNKGEDVDE